MKTASDACSNTCSHARSLVLAIGLAAVSLGWSGDSRANAWQEAKAAIRSFPANVKQGGREYGHAMRDSGRALGHAARDGYHHVRDGFRRDFIQGGAWRGAPGANRATAERTDPL